jgi:hypothetical protein
MLSPHAIDLITRLPQGNHAVRNVLDWTRRMANRRVVAVILNGLPEMRQPL